MINTPDIYKKLQERLSILDFIPHSEHQKIYEGSSNYDCHPALIEAISQIKVGSGWYVSGPAIYFPPGRYFFSKGFHVKNRVKLYGDGSGLPSGDQATIVFADGEPGFVFHRYDTDENGTQETPTTSADGSIIEGLSIHGSGVNPDAHGIRMRGKIAVRGVQVRGFGGNGIHVVADVNPGPNHGNANCFEIDVARITNCKGHGLYIDGGDANAGNVKALDVTENGGWGIYDSSFLGNTFIGCHAAGNGLGPYKTDNPNARSLFLGCYSEGGQNPSEIQFPSMVIGGLHGAGVKGTGVFALDGGFDKLKSNNGAGNPQIGIGTGAAISGDKSAVLSLSDPANEYWPIVLKWGAGRWRWLWANLDGGEILSFFTRSATKANGYQRDMSSSNGGIGLPKGYYGKGMKYRGEASSIPIDGEWLRGDVLWNESPVAGGNAGWICVEGGTPGTWKTFGAISA